jgi:DNA-binding NtrC family response regulator
MRRSLEILLHKEGYQVAAASDGEQAVMALHDFKPDVVVTDLRMEGLTGIDVLQQVKENYPKTSVIIMTAYATVDTAVMAMKLGAFDYITKPFKNQEILEKIQRAIADHKANSHVADTASHKHRGRGLETLVGDSVPMRMLNERIHQVAPTDLTVLITGQTGTGKTAVAKVIHLNSPRANNKFVSVNCAALPETLLESELFGHEKGSFTGATTTRIGLFVEAELGTLILDEIGAMPLSLQAKLLGVLQDREVRALGSNHAVQVDVRVIAATNINLEQAMAQGDFREDLYYRINVARLHLPALAERKEDVLPLVDYFLVRHSTVDGIEYRLDEEARELLMQYPYPGNVRELENALAWAAAICTDGHIGVKELPEQLRIRARTGVAEENLGTMQQQEISLILSTLERHGGNLSQTAKALGVSRTTLWRKLKEHGVKRLTG